MENIINNLEGKGYNFLIEYFKKELANYRRTLRELQRPLNDGDIRQKFRLKYIINELRPDSDLEKLSIDASKHADDIIEVGNATARLLGARV